MKKLVVLLMAMLVAASAFAVVDPDDNMMGFYFDMDADMPCVDSGPYVTINAYLMLTNPTCDSVYGFEAGYEIVGSGNAGLPLYPVDFTNIGGAGNFIVGYGTPVLATPATLLVTIPYFLMDTEPVIFSLYGATPSSIDPRYPVFLDTPLSMISAGLSAAEGPVAMINGGCTVVSTENVSFDSVKSLYR